jgi:hypothetical protein
MNTLRTNEALALWMAGQELAAAVQAGDAETARLAREELEAVIMHTDYGRHRAMALRLLDDAGAVDDGVPRGVVVILADWRGR